MTDAPFTETHRETLEHWKWAPPPQLREAIDAALAEIDRLTANLALARSALPDSETAGPSGTGYKYAWDELNDDEQEWVKHVRQETT